MLERPSPPRPRGQRGRRSPCASFPLPFHGILVPTSWNLVRRHHFQVLDAASLFLFVQLFSCVPCLEIPVRRCSGLVVLVRFPPTTSEIPPFPCPCSVRPNLGAMLATTPVPESRGVRRARPRRFRRTSVWPKRHAVNIRIRFRKHTAMALGYYHRFFLVFGPLL